MVAANRVRSARAPTRRMEIRFQASQRSIPTSGVIACPQGGIGRPEYQNSERRQRPRVWPLLLLPEMKTRGAGFLDWTCAYGRQNERPAPLCLTIRYSIFPFRPF
jgi:hypothetical protein